MKITIIGSNKRIICRYSGTVPTLSDIEGVEDLATGTFSVDAAQVNVAAAEGGKVKFTVTPKDDESGAIGSSLPTRFFFKARMKQLGTPTRKQTASS